MDTINPIGSNSETACTFLAYVHLTAVGSVTLAPVDDAHLSLMAWVRIARMSDSTRLHGRMCGA